MGLLAVGVCPKCKGKVYGVYMTHKRDVFRVMGCPHCPPVNPEAPKRKWIQPDRRFRLVPIRKVERTQMYPPYKGNGKI